MLLLLVRSILPWVHNAVHVSAHGINLAEMSATLLEKTEENTLYILELNKRIEKQDKKIKEQHQMIETLQKQVELLIKNAGAGK